MEVNYLIENATKNLWRTKGKLGTLFSLIILGGFCYFFTLYGFFTKHWQAVSRLEVQTNEFGAQSSNTLLPIMMTSSMSWFLAIAFFIAVIFYGKRSTIQFAYTQKEDFIIQSYLGEKTNKIALEYALQSICYMVISQLPALLIANYFFRKTTIGLNSSGEFTDLFASFPYPIWALLGMILFSIFYVFIGNFSHVYRLLLKDFKRET